MSLEDKIKNAKESHLFDELTDKERFESILEGKLKVRFIEKLEKIKAEINEYLTVSFADDEDFRWFNLCLDKHIKELKGENNELVWK